MANTLVLKCSPRESSVFEFYLVPTVVHLCFPWELLSISAIAPKVGECLDHVCTRISMGHRNPILNFLARHRLLVIRKVQTSGRHYLARCRLGTNTFSILVTSYTLRSSKLSPPSEAHVIVPFFRIRLQTHAK